MYLTGLVTLRILLSRVTINIEYFTLQSIFYTTGSSKNPSQFVLENLKHNDSCDSERPHKVDLTPKEMKYSNSLNMERKRKVSSNFRQHIF